MPSPTVNFRAIPPLDARLLERAGASDNLNDAARRDLSRYYAVLRDSLSRVSLSEGEASLIVDSLNGTIMDETSYLHLWMEVDDAELFEKWNVGRSALIAKLKALSPGETLAVIDAAERFWRLGVSTDKGLRIVGLVRSLPVYDPGYTVEDLEQDRRAHERLRKEGKLPSLPGT